MNNMISHSEEYINFCKEYKRLSDKTIKAYKIDILQFITFMQTQNYSAIEDTLLNEYITHIHYKYKPKTVKRKLASLNAFFTYLKHNNFISEDYKHILQVKFRQPTFIPKIIPIHILEKLFTTMYFYKDNFEDKFVVRDVAILELLFATGIRISELCELKKDNLDLVNGTIIINGKGSKERVLTLATQKVLDALKDYELTFYHQIKNQDYYFINNRGNMLSDQSVRIMIKKYSNIAGITQHITPHMFRHSFATLLLEQDVDIRYIQKMLGHSSINVTEIYTFVSSAKQKDILLHKNPRNLLQI
ncbi:MAG: recombinase XerC [Epulopiscium sp. Nele67-Bin005]|nr:MAG: recombinase XerC [Epulopiscium sp. Nele67-Bin005]